jgi:hypothetical protein
MSNRRAEARDVRPWEGAVAEANELDEVRTWVIWGDGPDVERSAEPERDERPGEPGNDIARDIARTNDPEWGHGGEPTWVRLVEADEDEVDALVLEDEQVRGYAPYLVNPEDAAAAPHTMRGVLRGDVVKRRKAKRFDTARPE